MVKKETCLQIAKKLELQKFVLILNGNKKKKIIEDKVLADGCEALIGAIYLEKGFATVEKIILNLWSKKIKESAITQVDAKTKLQELSLKNLNFQYIN